MTKLVTDPEGPSTQYLRILVPNTIQGMVFLRPKTLNVGYLDPLGEALSSWNQKSLKKFLNHAACRFCNPQHIHIRRDLHKAAKGRVNADVLELEEVGCTFLVFAHICVRSLMQLETVSCCCWNPSHRGPEDHTNTRIPQTSLRSKMCTIPMLSPATVNLIASRAKSMMDLGFDICVICLKFRWSLGPLSQPPPRPTWPLKKFSASCPRMPRPWCPLWLGPVGRGLPRRVRVYPDRGHLPKSLIRPISNMYVYIYIYGSPPPLIHICWPLQPTQAKKSSLWVEGYITSFSHTRGRAPLNVHATPKFLGHLG